MTTPKRFDRFLNLMEIGVLSLTYGGAALREHTSPGTASNFAEICQTRIRRLINKLNDED